MSIVNREGKGLLEEEGLTDVEEEGGEKEAEAGVGVGRRRDGERKSELTE